MANCPICGRHLGTFTNDPILTNPSLSTDKFKGFIQLIRTHIEELQTERHQQEIDNGVTPLTEFSSINDNGFFQNIKQYILELRDSTEKILAITGQTLAEFLSTDEDGNPMTPKSDWSDSNLEENNYQCKAIHIEDLRHFIAVGLWKETWEDTIYSDHTHVTLPETIDLHHNLFNADNLWSYLVGSGELSSSIGFCTGEATADVTISSSFSFYGEGHITDCPSQHYAGFASFFAMRTNVLTGGNIGEHTHFQVENGIYVEAGSVSGILPTDPILWEEYYHTPMPTSLPLPTKPDIEIFITLTDNKYIIYCIAELGMIPSHGILLSNLTFDRNIYNDFKVFYPSFAGGIISHITIRCECDGDSWDNIFYQQPPSIRYKYVQSNMLTVNMGTLKLKNVL